MPRLDALEQRQLLAIARRAIAGTWAEQDLQAQEIEEPSAGLRQERGNFVTLTQSGRLRGCIGSLEPDGDLAQSVRRNARLAAFEDPRFGPLAPGELQLSVISISVLEEPEPLFPPDEEALCRQLRPYLDGVILELGSRRATFLPQVWSQLPDPLDFLHELKSKAGLSPGSWSSDIRVWRYGAESFSEAE